MKSISAFVALALLPALPTHAVSKPEPTAFEKKLDGLRGSWFSDKGPANARSVLNVTNIVQVNGNSAKLAANWGGALAAWRSAREATATDAGGRLTVELLSWYRTKVNLELDTEGALVGTLALADGRNFPVRLVRTPQTQIYEWLAQNPLPAMRATRQSVIELVYVSAPDCPFCRGWEAEYMDGEVPKAKLGWTDVRLTGVQVVSFKSAARPDAFPPHLREGVAQILKDRGWSFLAGTPQYLLLVNGHVRAYAFGSANFVAIIQPALKAALAEKQG